MNRLGVTFVNESDSREQNGVTFVNESDIREYITSVIKPHSYSAGKCISLGELFRHITE